MTLKLGKFPTDVLSKPFPSGIESWNQQLWIGSEGQRCMKVGEIIVDYLLFKVEKRKNRKVLIRKKNRNVFMRKH